MESFEALPGHGIQVVIQGRNMLLGNKKLMNDRGIEITLQEDSDRLAEEGKTPMYIAIDGILAGIFAVADVVKESSQHAINALHKMGLEVVMITGDNRRTAEAIARQVGIDRVLAEVLPQDKADQVKTSAGRQKSTMVGDASTTLLRLLTDIGIAVGSVRM